MAGVPAVIRRARRRHGSRPATGFDALVLPAAAPSAAGQSHEAKAA